MRLSALLSVLFSGLIALPSVAAEVGSAAPAFTLDGLKNVAAGQKVSLANYKGKIVYVDFWASWCGPCQKSFPTLQALRTKYSAQGFEVVAVNMDENVKDAEDFLATHPVTFPVARDPSGKVAESFQVKGMPSAYLLDKQGKVLAVIEGFDEKVDVATIESAIKKANGK